MSKRSSIVGGVILILVGSLFLLFQLFPDLAEDLEIWRQWPLIIVAAGGLFLLSALFGTPPLAVPGSVITGIGGILYYQNISGNWASWAYVWTLFPAFAGIGILMMNALQGNAGHGVREGGRLVLISLVMFLIFGAFFNGLGKFGQYWPILFIVIGGWLLVRGRRQT